jgi:GNAT superfamily N-acetyltransferase
MLLPMDSQQGVDIRVAEPDRDHSAIAALMSDYLRWALGQLESQYGITDMPVGPEQTVHSLDAYLPPHGLAVIAEVEGRAAGVGALRLLEPGVAEVKRMYVHPDYRHRHLGSGVLDVLLAEAAATFQATTVRLDTCRFMRSAQRLYRSRGFEERPAYAGTEIPLRLQEYWMFFEKRLVPLTAATDSVACGDAR